MKFFSFKLLALFSAVAVTALPTALPDGGKKRETSQLSVRADPFPPPTPISVNLKARDPELPRRGRMTLQWSTQGRIMFLVCANLPTAILDAYFGGIGTREFGEAILQNFRQWLDERTTDADGLSTWWNFLSAEKGGVFGVGGTRSDIFGFGLQTAILPEYELQEILDAINAWASEVASDLQVIPRPNDFFDLSKIGAAPSKRDNGAKNVAELEKRSRTNQCPAKTDLLQYVNGDVPDLDINREIRWAGECDP
ncbi:hypothetical protein MMC22_008212 [Lobaria immixta]|nr:hypothetical protein [Lobaria immixta]